MEHFKVLSIGDNCVDYYREMDLRFPGGNALNVAVYSSRFSGVKSNYVGVIGTDNNGDFIKDQITKEGLSTSYLIRKEGETAVTVILLRGGDRVFESYLEGVQAEVVYPTDLVDLPKSYDLVHFTVWGFGRELVKDLSNGGKPLLSCDFSGQVNDPRTDIMKHLDYSFFSGSELIRKGVDLTKTLRELKEMTPGVVVMTLGSHGSVATDGENYYSEEAAPTEVVDTLGAGDSYIASFLVKRLRGDSIPDSMRAGHRSAAEVCRRLGAWGGG
jgi:fructoselysine 6-kinase